MELNRNQEGSVSFSPTGPIVGEIRPPGSKSITNRAVLCAAMASGASQLIGVLESEDTLVMIEAWKQLGLKLDWDKANSRLSIEGCGGTLPAIQNDTAKKLYVANSGTTLRFLTAALATIPGKFELSGVARMHQRPAADLVLGLKQLGADIESINQGNPGCPPLAIDGKGMRGGTASIAGSVSSQFLSGLMMAAPYAKNAVELQVVGSLVSKPYVTMTSAVMKSFGVEVEELADQRYRIQAPQFYQGCEFSIEPDASAASYFFAIAAITQGKVRVLGLTRQSLQGDVDFVTVLERMGCTVRYGEDWIEVEGGTLRGVDVDMNTMSDTVQTLAAVALFADGETRVRGVAHNRHKETDRIGDLATELRKLGAIVEEFDDGLSIIPPSKCTPATIETYNDHRMAMSLSLVGLKVPGIWITNPKCTEKTYPLYFEDVCRLA